MQQMVMLEKGAGGVFVDLILFKTSKTENLQKSYEIKNKKKRMSFYLFLLLFYCKIFIIFFL